MRWFIVATAMALICLLQVIMAAAVSWFLHVAAGTNFTTIFSAVAQGMAATNIILGAAILIRALWVGLLTELAARNKATPEVRR